MRFILLASSLTALSSAQAIWQTKNGMAVSNSRSKVGDESVLFKGGNSGAQFMYDKVNGTIAPLVTVSLTNGDTGAIFILQENFAVSTQTCSCYFLDANELTARFSSLSSSLNYSILFKSADGKVQLQSGLLGIVVSGTTTAGLPAPNLEASPTSPASRATEASQDEPTIEVPKPKAKKSDAGRSITVGGSLAATIALLCAMVI